MRWCGRSVSCPAHDSVFDWLSGARVQLVPPSPTFYCRLPLHLRLACFIYHQLSIRSTSESATAAIEKANRNTYG